jgi:hypothetical protein
MTLASVAKYEANENVTSAAEAFKAYDPLVKTEGCKSTLEANQFTGSKSWDDAYQAKYWPAAEDGSIVGINIQDFSRIVSQELVDSKEGLQIIKDYLVGLPASIPFIWQNCTCFEPRFRRSQYSTEDMLTVNRCRRLH